jgi:hypothetical protein
MIDKTNWEPANLSWLAGILEGEGYFGYTAGKMRVECEMSDEDVIKRVHYVAGFGSTHHKEPRKEGHKPLWRWGSQNQREVADFFDYMFFLMGNRRQTQIYSAMNERLQYELTARSHIKRVFSEDGSRLLSDTA